MKGGIISRPSWKFVGIAGYCFFEVVPKYLEVKVYQSGLQLEIWEKYSHETKILLQFL